MSSDTVTSEVRSRMMAGIGSKDTKPELIVRSALHRLGFRFRVHRKDLPGKPDIVLPKYQAVIFIHGCFWHGHECHLFRWPKTRNDFWMRKIKSNIARDQKHILALTNDGWRVGVIWECALRGRSYLPISAVVKHCAEWLNSDKQKMRLVGDESWTVT